MDNMEGYKKEIVSYLELHNIKLANICKVKQKCTKKALYCKTITPIGNKIVGVSLTNDRSNMRILVSKKNSKHGVVAYQLNLQHNNMNNDIDHFFDNVFNDIFKEPNDLKYYVNKYQKIKLSLLKGVKFNETDASPYICRMTTIYEKCIGWDLWFPVANGEVL